MDIKTTSAPTLNNNVKEKVSIKADNAEWKGYKDNGNLALFSKVNGTNFLVATSKCDPNDAELIAILSSIKTK